MLYSSAIVSKSDGLAVVYRFWWSVYFITTFPVVFLNDWPFRKTQTAVNINIHFQTQNVISFSKMEGGFPEPCSKVSKSRNYKYSRLFRLIKSLNFFKILYSLFKTTILGDSISLSYKDNQEKHISDLRFRQLKFF